MGTEPPFIGIFLYNYQKRVCVCAGCYNSLFSYDKQYGSGSGWPSFYDVIGKDAVELRNDDSLGMKRVGVLCNRCGSHLGHVFDEWTLKNW